ncbi:MAG: peptide deformylase [Alkalilacustris sp.]
MTIRPILIHPDPRLKKVCAPVDAVTDDLRQLAADMLETMYDAPGVGLAAPQVGVLKRIIVMDCNKLPEAEPRPLVMFNPQILWESADIVASEEGCLSLPDQFAPVERSAEVRARWMGLDGQIEEETFDGLWSVCLQHEVDHLDGVLFIDHLGFMKRQMITRRLAKLMRERSRG